MEISALELNFVVWNKKSNVPWLREIFKNIP